MVGMQHMPREEWVDLERTARPCGPAGSTGGCTGQDMGELPKTAAKPEDAHAQTWGVSWIQAEPWSV